MNSWIKTDLNLKIHLHKAFFGGNLFLDSLDKLLLDQTTLNLRKEKSLKSRFACTFKRNIGFYFIISYLLGSKNHKCKEGMQIRIDQGFGPRCGRSIKVKKTLSSSGAI